MRSSPYWRISIRRVTRFNCGGGCEAHGLVTPFLTDAWTRKAIRPTTIGVKLRVRLEWPDHTCKPRSGGQCARCPCACVARGGGEEAAQMAGKTDGGGPAHHVADASMRT
jgi:hypothetical protein